jgi:hypothetical protein
MEEINPRLLVQSLTISDDALKLKTPFCLSISGPSQAKSNVLIRITKKKN